MRAAKYYRLLKERIFNPLNILNSVDSVEEPLGNREDCLSDTDSLWKLFEDLSERVTHKDFHKRRDRIKKEMKTLLLPTASELPRNCDPVKQQKTQEQQSTNNAEKKIPVFTITLLITEQILLGQKS